MSEARYHGCPKKAEAIRRAKRNSHVRLRALPRRRGGNPKIVIKWGKRGVVADLEAGPGSRRPHPCRWRTRQPRALRLPRVGRRHAHGVVVITASMKNLQRQMAFIEGHIDAALAQLRRQQSCMKLARSQEDRRLLGRLVSCFLMEMTRMEEWHAAIEDRIFDDLQRHLWGVKSRASHNRYWKHRLCAQDSLRTGAVVHK